MSNFEVLALDPATPQIRAPGAGDGYSVPRDMTLASGTTLTAPTVNATTVDATNVEVTNIKAKDGTAAGSIADSTGVVTLGSSVLTTTDINGGTIDGTTIGASSAAAGTFTSATVSTGNLTFSSTAQRITGDMSNATGTNRLAFQTSTTNGNTILQAIPNGTATQTNLLLYANTDLANTAALNIFQNATESTIRAIALGTGSNTPMTFYTGGSERMRLDTSGNLGIGTASPNGKVEIADNTSQTNDTLRLYNLNGAYSQASINFHTTAQGGVGSVPTARIYATYTGAGYGNQVLRFQTGDSGGTYQDRMTIDSSGNVGIGGTAGASNKVDVGGTLPTSSNYTEIIRAGGTIPSGSTSNASCFISFPSTQAASFTLGSLYHFRAVQNTFGASSAVTDQFGFFCGGSLTGATNNYGFYSNIASGSNRWNFYAGGTAQNYFAGNTGIGVTPGSDQRLNVRGSDSTSSNTALVVSNSSATNMFYVRNDNYLNSAAVNNYSVAGTTVVIDGSNFLGKTTSSLRYKKDVVNYDKGLAAISKLRPVYYKSAVEGPNGLDPKQHAGLIAEEIEAEGFEEFLIRDNDGRAESIQYPNMVALLVKAVQELSAKVAALEAR